MVKNEDAGIAIDHTILKLKFEAILAEYRALVDEKLDSIRRQQQLVLYSFLVTAGAIPAIFSLLNASDIKYLAALLIILSLVLSSLLLANISYTKGYWDIARYLNFQLGPQANNLLRLLGEAEYTAPVLRWESFVRSKRLSTRSDFLLDSLHGFGELSLTVIPVVGCIALLFYITYGLSYTWYPIHYFLVYAATSYFMICLLACVIYWFTLSKDEPGIRQIQS